MTSGTATGAEFYSASPDWLEAADPHGDYSWRSLEVDANVPFQAEIGLPTNIATIRTKGEWNSESLPVESSDVSERLEALEKAIDRLLRYLEEDRVRLDVLLSSLELLMPILAQNRSSISNAALYEEFKRLARQWEEETSGYSLSTQEVLHPAYLRIIGMGERAIPWILEEMSARKGQWFVALRAITGEDPVPHEDRGRRPKMRAAWQDWGRAHGWIL